MGMTEIAIGPLALPTAFLVTFGAIMLGSALGNRIAKSEGVQIERLLWLVIGIAVVAARAVFISQYWSHYAAEPWRLVDVRDGGFRPAAGIAAALIASAWLVGRRPLKRKALLSGVFAGSLLWVAGTVTFALYPSSGRLPELTLTDLAGKTVPLSTFAGKPVVVNLWASWCPPCRREMPVLESAQRSTPGVAFVFANQGESAEKVNAYLKAESLTLKNMLLDPAGSVAAAANAPGLPTTLFFDATGRLVDRKMGELSPATLGERLERLVAVPGRPAPEANPITKEIQ
jgi:thiol-disulfide isomerase/thioredoxin